MRSASEIESVFSGISLWRAYDPTVKAELFSTALETAAGIYVVDPIPLEPTAMTSLTARSPLVGVIVTNENHERAAAHFAGKFKVPLYLHPAVSNAIKLSGVSAIHPNSGQAEWRAVAIEGAPVGEIAIHFAAAGGTMVVGDTLINFDPYGFALLPAKYCSNFKLMRRSLSKLLDYSFERMFFAHGMPILAQARERLELLLKEQR